MVRFTRKRALLCSAAAFIATVATFAAVALVNNNNASAATTQLTVGSGVGNTTYFWATVGGNKQEAWCGDADLATPASGTYSMTEVSVNENSSRYNQMIFGVMYEGAKMYSGSAWNRAYVTHNALQYAVHGNSGRLGVFNATVRNLYDTVGREIDNGTLFDGITNAKYYVIGTRSQTIYTFTYTVQQEEHFNVSVSKTWNDTTNDPNVANEVYDIFNGNNVTNLVPHSANIRIKFDIDVTYGGVTKNLRSWVRGSDSNFSASESGISCKAIKRDLFGVNDSTCSDLIITSTETPVETIFQSPALYESSVNYPNGVTISDNSTANFVFNNEFYTTEVGVNKTWEDNNSLENDERPHYVTFVLKYRLANSTEDTWETFKTYEKVETHCSMVMRTALQPAQKAAICSAANETFTFDNLPAFLKINGQYRLVEYKAFETNLYDANQNDITNKYEKTEGDITFTNTQHSRQTTQGLTNSDLTSFPVWKVWYGDQNYQSDRPQSITAALMCGNDAVLDENGNPKTLELNAGNDWQGEFTNLSKQACNNYRVEETVTPSHYTKTESYENGIWVLRNFHDVDVKVKKTWTGVTDNDPDVTDLTVALTCSNDKNTILEQVTLNAGNNWEHTWSGRNYNECGDGGSEYYVKEIGYNGSYTLSGTVITQDTDGTWVYTMNNIKNIDIPVTKAWEARSNDIRTTEATAVLLCEDPSSGDVNPYQYDDGSVAKLTLNAGNNWSGTFTNIKNNSYNTCKSFDIAEQSADGNTLYAEGQVVSATTAASGNFKFKVHYTGNAAQGFTITNEQVIDIPVTKDWDDDNANNRPTDITALLMCNRQGMASTVKKSETLSASNNWSHTWTNLSTSECDSYSVDEIYPTSHGYDESYTYESSVTGDESTGFVIKNTKYVNIPAVKIWNYRNSENIPAQVQITLTCNGSDFGSPVTLDTSVSLPRYTFKHQKASDCPTGFGVREIVPAGANYNATVAQASSTDKTQIITNTENYSIPVEKRWDTGKSSDDLPDSVDVALYCSNDDTETLVDTITLLKSQNWRGSFGPYANGSCDGEYSVEEVTDLPGFEVTISGNADDGFRVTNTEYTTLKVNKTWEKRNTTEIPSYIRLYLMCYDDQENPTSMHRTAYVRPDAVTGSWSYDFGKLKTSACDNYGVEEELPGGFSFELTENSKTGDTVNLTNTEQIYVPVRKVWNANDDAELPEEVTAKLYCGETKVDEATLEAPFYYHEFGPYNIDACNVAYTVEEDPEVEGFAINYSTSEDGELLITNTEEQEITVTKNWEVAEGKQVELPNSITVALWCETTDSEIANNRKTLTKEQNYAGGWSGIRRDTCAELGVREVAADGTTILSTVGDRYNNYFFYGGVTGSAAEGFTITNTYDGIDISGTKTWDFTDEYGNVQSVSKRPIQISVILKQNGTAVETVAVSADATGAWNYSFDNWPKYDASGNEYTYTIDEAAVAYYVTTINGYNITNKYKPDYTTVTASKDWATLAGTTLPDQVEVKLYCGDTDLQKSKYITKASNWAAVSWEHLDVQECEAGYKVEEVLPEGFAKSVTVGSNNNYTFTNAETVDIPVTKSWVKRNTTTLPESVTVALFCETDDTSTRLDEQTLSEANNWTYTWTTRNVKDDNCEGGAYVVDETSTTPNFKKTRVDYTTEDGYVIENTETTSQTVIKIWEGDTAQNRPGSITAELMCGDTVKKTAILSEENNYDHDNIWEYTWNDLLVSECEQGYTVRESFDIPNYKTSYETRDDGTVVITNRRTTSQTVIKVWKNDDRTKRPGYIEASLMCGDQTIDTVRLSEENNLDGDDTWEYTWPDLFVSDCEQGYTVDESINIPNYHKTVKILEDGTVVITNEFRNPETIDKFSLGRIAGISTVVLVAGYFATRKIFSRR